MKETVKSLLNSSYYILNCKQGEFWRPLIEILDPLWFYICKPLLKMSGWGLDPTLLLSVHSVINEIKQM